MTLPSVVHPSVAHPSSPTTGLAATEPPRWVRLLVAEDGDGPIHLFKDLAGLEIQFAPPRWRPYDMLGLANGLAPGCA